MNFRNCQLVQNQLTDGAKREQTELANQSKRADFLTSGIGEAKWICPGIALAGARHRVCARMNRKFEMAVDAAVEIERVRSIDEFQARLSATDQELDQAIMKAREVKKRISAAHV